MHTIERKGYIFHHLFIIVSLGIFLSFMFMRRGPFQENPQVLILFGMLFLLFFTVISLSYPLIFFSYYFLLLPLFPRRGILMGFNFSELLTLYAMILGFLILISQGRNVFKPIRKIRSLILLNFGIVVVSVISTLYNQVFHLQNVVSVIFKPLSFILIMIVVSNLFEKEHENRKLLKYIIYGGFLSALFAIFTFFTGKTVFFEYAYYGFRKGRAMGTFENSNTFGGFMVMLAPLAISLTIMEKNNLKKAFYFLISAALVIGIFTSQTLGSIFAVVLASLFAFVLVFKKGRAGIFKYALLIVVGLILAYFVVPGIRDRINMAGERFNARLAGWWAGWQIAKDHFWWGLGSKDRVIETLRFDPEGYKYTPFGLQTLLPHNSFLAIWAENGVFSAILLLLLVVNIFLLAIKMAKNVTSKNIYLYMGWLISVTGFLIQSNSNMLLLNAQLGIIFYSLITIIPKILLTNERK